MCGFLAFFTNDGLNTDYAETVKSAGIHLLKRGPDAFNSFSDQKSVFIHSRLAIYDLEVSSNQPFCSACGRYTLVFNGSIYNYKILRETKFVGNKWSTNSDTEVLLQGLIEYGS